MFLASAGLAQAQTKPQSVTLVSSTVNPPSVSNVYYLAAMGGPLQKRGIEVHLQQSSGSPSSVAAIVSGRAEFASVNLNTFASAVAEGVKGKVVVAGSFDSPGVILSRPDITSVKMLEGKKMASASFGSMEYTIARAYLTQQDVDFSKIDWVATRQSSVTLQALMAGQVAAAWFNMASAAKALQKAPDLHILVTAEQLAKSAPTTGGIIIVTDRYIQQHGDVVKNFVEAIVEGNRMLYKDKGYFDATVEKWLPGVYDAKQKQLLYEAYRPSWGVNGGLNLKVMGHVLEGWKTDVNPKRAKNPYFSKIEDLVDTQFARAALQKLGVYKGSLDDAAWMK
jgi:ABC-type nitrate/sulfonate/bicarbonate transport system substrate-binding protein